MPWSGTDFEKKNHSLHGAEAGHAARIANAILKRGESERIAIATANKYFERHDDGGNVSGTTTGGYQGGPGGLQPSNQTSNPLTQGMIQRYASMPVERLQELSSMMGGSPQGQIIQRVLQQKRAMPQATTPQQQPSPQQMPAPGQQPGQQPSGTMSVTTAQHRGGATPRRDMGGGMSLGTLDPSWARGELRSADQGGGATGYLHGATSGRGDAILTTAPSGSYVIPADVIAGLGEGNSLAGANVMQKIISTGPGGIPLPRTGGRNTIPRPPPLPRDAKGGAVPGQREQTPVALSHGEFVVPPEHVAHWGGGDEKKGHAIFDRFVSEMRKQIIKTMQKLPGPVGAKTEKKKSA